MQAINIEILNPNAIDLIEGMQKLKLIRITKEPKVSSAVTSYLKRMRKNTGDVPDSNEIQKIVKQVRKERYAKR